MMQEFGSVFLLYPFFILSLHVILYPIFILRASVEDMIIRLKGKGKMISLMFSSSFGKSITM